MIDTSTSPHVDVNQLKQQNIRLHSQLERLLFLLNEDKDGSYFFCAEAKHDIEQARQLLAESPVSG